MAGSRILIVEDEAVVAWDLEDVLTREGHHICGCAPNYETALLLAEANRPDLVLVDLRLANGTSGLATASEIYHRFGIRSLFLSGNIDARTEQAATEDCRPIGFLEKPFEIGLFRKLIETMR